MSKKIINTEAAERIKLNQIQTLEGFSLGDMVWARLQDGIRLDLLSLRRCRRSECLLLRQGV